MRLLPLFAALLAACSGSSSPMPPEPDAGAPRQCVDPRTLSCPPGYELHCIILDVRLCPALIDVCPSPEQSPECWATGRECEFMLTPEDVCDAGI